MPRYGPLGWCGGWTDTAMASAGGEGGRFSRAGIGRADPRGLRPARGALTPVQSIAADRAVAIPEQRFRAPKYYSYRQRRGSRVLRARRAAHDRTERGLDLHSVTRSRRETPPGGQNRYPVLLLGAGTGKEIVARAIQ
jgi:hypothetical protein